MNEIFQEGYDAYFKGVVMDKCPYPKDPEKDEWEVGWLSANNDDLQDEYFGGNWPGCSRNPL